MSVITPEQLITELTIERDKLKTELEEAQEHIKDFERLAIEWKRGYDQMKRGLDIKIKHLEQAIEEMEKEKG